MHATYLAESAIRSRVTSNSRSLTQYTHLQYTVPLQDKMAFWAVDCTEEVSFLNCVKTSMPNTQLCSTTSSCPLTTRSPASTNAPFLTIITNKCNAKQSDLCQKFEVNGYPTLFYFEKYVRAHFLNPLVSHSLACFSLRPLSFNSLYDLLPFCIHSTKPCTLL